MTQFLIGLSGYAAMLIGGIIAALLWQAFPGIAFTASVLFGVWAVIYVVWKSSEKY